MDHSKITPEELAGLLQNGSAQQPSLTALETEALRELLAVALRSAAPAVSAGLELPVVITAPQLSPVTKQEFFSGMAAPLWIGLGEFTGTIRGTHVLAIEQAAGLQLTQMTDATPAMEAWQGVIQNMFERVARSFSAVLEEPVEHALTGMDAAGTADGFIQTAFAAEERYIASAFELKTGAQDVFLVHLYMPLPMAKGLAGYLVEETEQVEETVAAEQEEVQQMEFEKKDTGGEQQPASHSEPVSSSVQPVQFSSFGDTASTQVEPNNLDLLMDIPLQVTVELGRTKRMVKEILGLSQGSIIELDKLAGEPVDILVNDKLIAVGEVVVIDENFGVRVTDILSAAERISKLR